MKKFVTAVFILLLAGSVNLFAFGIGVQGGFGVGDHSGGGAAVTFKVDSLPYIFAVNASFGSDNTFIGASADYWLVNKNFAGPLNYFFGAGVGAGIGFGDDFCFNAAFRIPIGINAFFVNNFIEPYLQLVPEVGISVLPSLGLHWNIGANLGIRFWL
ncbi:MAG TPA: hypothetical protein GXZ47_06310 [Treponema sp.]|nr:hypothetical protein [Treponema sp.]